MRAVFLRVFIIVILVSGVFLIVSKSTQRKSPSYTPKTEKTPNGGLEIPDVSVVAQNLEIPWALAFLPGGRILFTERPGRVRMVDEKGTVNTSPIITLDHVKRIGEGGLLGIAVHPDFAHNRFVYLYYTYSSTRDDTSNRVSRYTFENDTLTDERVIVDAIPGASNHNGGRIKFGPDGFLYITTGDAQNPSRAQNTTSLAGKILRVTDDGQPAPNNPFGTVVYSFGHRNPQGLTWDAQGALWATEHGRSGIQSGLDELNLIEAGKNYGWPIIQGNEKIRGMESPKIHSGDDTWAPAGAAFVGTSLFFGGLRGQALYEAAVQTGNITLRTHFKQEFGRIRDVVSGPDGMLYITTSNRDGRGSPAADDDKLIKINPLMFKK